MPFGASTYGSSLYGGSSEGSGGGSGTPLDLRPALALGGNLAASMGPGRIWWYE